MRSRKSIRSTLAVIGLSFTVIASQISGLASEVRNIPPWVNELRSNASRAFHAELIISSMNKRDDIDGKEYYMLELKGEGSLKEVSDPFMVMRKLFLSNGSNEDLEYAADGHGSSSIAYRKESYFCIASVRIDSSCDDEETGHVATKFWISIDCRDARIFQ